MEELLTFDQVIERVKNPHLLLGNGFSIAYDSERFSFTTLLESAVKEKIISVDSEVYKVFQKLETADFESVMRTLEESEKVIEVYGGSEDVRQKLKKDCEGLKGYLVQIITNNHPEKSTSIFDEEKKACLSFLNNFSSIYTLNYDLLLYWVLMSGDQTKFPDGFGNTEDSEFEGYVVYDASKNIFKMKVHYLHGALHYFDAESEIIKKTFINTDIPLVEQVRESLDENKYPIFISEGSSEQKMTKIMHSAYLYHCYKSLKSIGTKTKDGYMVIFGASLKSNDEHILNAIFANNINNIYMGVSSLDGTRYIAERFASHNRTAKRVKNLYFFDYKTVNVWGR